MKGHIKPVQNFTRCPACDKKFVSDNKKGYLCRKCKTACQRYSILFKHRGKRYLIQYDRTGGSLDTYERALNCRQRINEDINKNCFDPSKYKKENVKDYLFKRLVERWLETKENCNTHHIMQRFADIYFIPSFGHYDVREILADHIDDFIRNIKGKNYYILSGKSKQNILTTLRSFFTYLLKHRKIDAIPEPWPTVEVVKPVINWVDIEEQATVLRAIPEADRPLYLFLAGHGCRPSEGRSLRVRDINFGRKEVIIQRTFAGKSSNIDQAWTKTRKHRVIPLATALIPILQDCCRGKFGDDYVFTNPRARNGKKPGNERKVPYCKSTYQKIWSQACDETGIHIKCVNATRHSFACQRINAGVSIYLIQKVLGHTSVKTTEKRYVDATTVALEPVINLPVKIQERKGNI
jgi:integrase